jgi:quinohemoprotein ethanol dehydrogenase
LTDARLLAPASVVPASALALVAAMSVHVSDAAQLGAITAERLQETHREPQNWLSTGRDYSDTHFSPLTSITDGNVKRLGLAWFYDLDTHRGQEATPIVVDGVMYTSTAWSKVLALEAATGKLLWQFDPKVPGEAAAHACCDVVSTTRMCPHRRCSAASTTA